MIEPKNNSYLSKLKTEVLFFSLFVTAILFSQNSEVNAEVPPPPCYANGNNGFGGAVGEGSFLASDPHPDNIIWFNMTTSSNEMNDILVLYLDTGAPGRNVIDLNIDDSADAHRIAISNSDAFGFGSVIQFPSGFEASYAVAINTDFAGLWSIPVSGSVGDNGLNFVTPINSTLTSSTQGFYEIDFDWSDIGLTDTDTFNFVGVYISNTGYSSDEGYGGGIVSGTEGADNITFNEYLSFPNCSPILSDSDEIVYTIDAKYYDNELYISGVNENIRVRVYDILGKEVYSGYHQVQDNTTLSLELSGKQLYFIVIQTANQRKVIKVMPQ